MEVNLFKLAKKKERLNKKLTKIQAKIEEINVAALSQKGQSWGKDLFVKCLVENLHFVQVPKGNGSDAECVGCGHEYKLVPK